MKIDVAVSAGRAISLPLSRANRHGLITGSTGGGKTTTLQRLAEEFSRAGVPVFAADVKGDLSGVATPGGALGAKAEAMGVSWRPEGFPVHLWDIYGTSGTAIRTSVQAVGAPLLARMLRLNEVQEGTLAIAFKKAEDDEAYMLTLDDLRWGLNDILSHREQICRQYGNITASSVSAIQRQILSLEQMGGASLFGEPPFEIADLLRRSPDGRGVINLLHAEELMKSPKVYAILLLWLLRELFEELQEVGDIPAPKLVFFFDEAHLLFSDAPKELIQQIERLVRLVRSKGIGVFFVTQSPLDIPDTVLAQLGSRIQHSLRAYTPKDQRMVKAAAQAFRKNKGVDVRAEITNLGVGEALISLLDEDGVPSPVEKASVIPPAGRAGPLTEEERAAIIAASPLTAKYAGGKDRRETYFDFTNRFRVASGKPPRSVPTVEEHKLGDFAKFVPDFNEIPREAARVRRATKFRELLFWSSFLIADVVMLQWLMG